MKLLATALIFLIYGTLSESTPDNPGLPEAAIGALLVYLVGAGAIYALGGELLAKRRFVPTTAMLTFVWFLIVPSVIGLFITLNDPTNYIRDVIPLMYLMLPVLVFRHMKDEHEKWAAVIKWGLAFVGVCYTTRFFYWATGNVFESVLYDESESYFMMDPAVIFGATFLLLSAIDYFYARRIWLAALTFLAGGYIYTGILTSGFRGQILLVAVSIVASIFIRFAKRPMQARTWMLFVFAFAVAIAVDAPEKAEWVWDTMTAKTADAGLANNRNIEAAQVVEHLAWNPGALAFGYGWGSKLYLSTSNSAVRYAHNTLIYVVWKTGLVGLAIFVGGLLWWVLRRFAWIGARGLRDPSLMPVWFAILNTLIIHGLLEVGYKMLTMGFVMCLILLVGERVRASRSGLPDLARDELHLARGHGALRDGEGQHAG